MAEHLQKYRADIGYGLLAAASLAGIVAIGAKYPTEVELAGAALSQTVEQHAKTVGLVGGIAVVDATIIALPSQQSALSELSPVRSIPVTVTAVSHER